MKITKCHRCHKKGHWSRECPEKGDSTGAAAGSGFVLLNESEPSYAILASENITSINARGLIHQVVDRIRSEKVEAMSLLVTGSGDIVVDTAAGQALIGPQALRRLEKRLGELGFRVVRVKSKRQFARGVGGKTPVQSGLLVPTGIEGKTGIMELDLIEQDVPALMPISMQEQMKAVIDLPKAEMTLRALGVTTSLKRLSRGHRTIAIDKLGSPEDFELPEAVRKRFGLQASDFRLSSSESYAMTGSTASDSGEPQCVKYLLTGNEYPNGLSVGDKFWAYLSSRIVADHQHKGLKLLRMFQNGHQWPIKTKKADRFYTERQMKCSHSWARLISFGNSHGSWEVCGDCDMRVSYFQKASVIYKGKGKSLQSGSTVLNVSDLAKPPGGRASVRNSVECTRVALMTTTSDRGPTQGSEEPMRVKKRSEEMVQYRALEAPMEVDSTGPARPRQHAPRASLISEIKSMKEEMPNQNHGLLALVVEQGKAIQHIQAAQLGIQEKQAMMERQMAIEDQPKTLPPQVPAQRTKQSLKDGRCLYGLSEMPEAESLDRILSSAGWRAHETFFFQDHPTVKDGFQEGRSFHQRDSFQEGCSFHQRDSFQEGGSFHQTDSFPIRNEKFRDPSKTDLRVQKRRMGCLGSWDLETGWDFREGGVRLAARQRLRKEKPAVAMMEPPCQTHSAMFRVSKGSMDSEHREALISEGLTHLHHAVDLALIQYRGRAVTRKSQVYPEAFCRHMAETVAKIVSSMARKSAHPESFWGLIDQVLEYVKASFSCPDCDAHPKDAMKFLRERKKLQQAPERPEGMTERGWSGSWVECGSGNADVELVPGEGSEAGLLQITSESAALENRRQVLRRSCLERILQGHPGPKGHLQEIRDDLVDASEADWRLLQRIPAFCTAASKAFLSRVHKDADVQLYCPGDFLAEEGEASASMMVVTAGVCRSEHPQTLFFVELKRGDWCFQNNILGIESTRAHDVVAVTHVMVLVLHRHALLNAVVAHPDAGEASAAGA
ncbi:unnamed protein product [Prorocentrum cordatum]|uniref:CCHC-type domain-containing protein n=1 Tax=Prorocentrum cordatum TaxID=2364126 RepID=A0ABN9SAH0_9DINO|nr:unnamed protein product [Polarella glacialis]